MKSNFLLAPTLILFSVFTGLSCGADAPIAGEIVSYGCCGGVTGGCSGGVIHRDGRILVWTSGPASQSRSEHNLPKNREGVARLFALLEELKFEDIDSNHPFYNMRCSLTLTTEGSDHTVSWGDGRVPVPRKLQRILDEVEKLSETPNR